MKEIQFVSVTNGFGKTLSETTHVRGRHAESTDNIEVEE